MAKNESNAMAKPRLAAPCLSPQSMVLPSIPAQTKLYLSSQWSECDVVLEVSVDCPIASLCAYWLIDWLIDCWLSYCIASERDCEPRGLYPDSLQPIESVPQNFNEHARVDFLPKDKRSDLLRNKWIPPPPLELWLRKRLVCVCVRCFRIAHHSSRSRFSLCYSCKPMKDLFSFSVS